MVITALVTCSVVAGMDKGIKNLSLLNMALAITLMLFVFEVMFVPTIFTFLWFSIFSDILDQFEKCLNFLHISPVACPGRWRNTTKCSAASRRCKGPTYRARSRLAVHDDEQTGTKRGAKSCKLIYIDRGNPTAATALDPLQMTDRSRA